MLVGDFEQVHLFTPILAPARLSWHKAQGCFTEIIRYQTRLFVPVDRAAAVLARLMPQSL